MVKPDADDWMPPDKKRLRDLEQEQEQEQEQEELTPEETKWWQQWQSGEVHQGSINVKRSKGTGKDDSVLMYEFKFEKKKDGSKFEPAEEYLKDWTTEVSAHDPQFTQAGAKVKGVKGRSAVAHTGRRAESNTRGVSLLRFWLLLLTLHGCPR